MKFRVIMRSRVHMDEKDTNNKAEYQKKQDDIIVRPALYLCIAEPSAPDLSPRSGLQMILSVSCARDDGVQREPCARSEWTYAHGIRVCCDASSVMVGMFFSYLYPFIL